MINRRVFLKQSGASALAFSTLASPARSAAGANEKIVLGVIGPGGMGMNLLSSFAGMADVEISHVCDPDEKRAADAAKKVEEVKKRAPKIEKDLRRLLEAKEIDAVIIATPDHWHAPATILACQAGKHVYVEKPCSHNLREGRLMIEAARRSNRVVQTGTQSRSTEHVMKAMELLKSGAIGDVLSAKAWNSQLRSSIGRAKPSAPPPNLDFDLWLGPAPVVPYQSNLLHGSWRWFHAFGTGDMGNDGVHDIDIARWGLGVERHPDKIMAMGGKYFFDDDQQFPDTQYVLFQYNERAARQEGRVKPGQTKQLIFEQRIWSPYVQEGYENGNAFYGTKGMLVLGKGKGFQLFGPRNELREKVDGSVNGGAHHRNFLECIRSGKKPNADIEIGHLSASLCHLGNIATRTGRGLQFDPEKEQMIGDSEANGMLKREYRQHWAAVGKS